MQTFLPYSDYLKTAKCLDYKRLGKQRVEAYQILNSLMGLHQGRGWKNHPAVKMWKGHEYSLALYGFTMCVEWVGRGYRDTLAKRFTERALLLKLEGKDLSEPDWIKNEDFNKSHQSNLVRKDPEYYRKFFPDVPNDLLYWWPTKDNTHFYEVRRAI
jgi:hypothetical protein